MNEVFPRVFKEKGKLYTFDFKADSMREWSPHHSKIAAGIMKGLKIFPISEGSRVLYLGSAQGTTVSHLSNIVGESGLIAGIDVSAKAMQSFMALAEEKGNIIPVLADANKPEKYSELKEIGFDVLCQDVAQKNQAEIFLKNSAYLNERGYGLLSLKLPAISPERNLESIAGKEKALLEKEFNVMQEINIVPYEKKHKLLLLRKK